MSFAYIDSQGKEVSIPGPDALRLRIELGAITDSTRFYDVAQDRWGAASEHEIYRQLKRDLAAAQATDFRTPVVGDVDEDLQVEREPAFEAFGEAPKGESDEALGGHREDVSDEGLIDDFGWAEEPDPPGGRGPAPEVETSDDSRPPSDSDSAAEESPQPVTEESAEPYFASELDADVFDRTMADTPSSDASDAPDADALMWPEGATAAELDEGMDTFTLSTPGSSSVVEDDASTEEDGHAVDDGDPEDLGFDFGAAVLELEDDDTEEAAEEPPAASQPDDGPDFGMVFEGGAPNDSFAEEVEDVAGRTNLQDGERGADEPDRPDGPAGGSEGGGSTPEDPYQRTIRERRGPRSRPPRRGGGSGPIRVAAGFLVLAAAGAAGAWFLTGSDDEAPDTVEVVVPALPAELQPRFEQLAQRATSGLVAEFDSLPLRLVLPDQPGPQWLSGPYLSSASSFDGVEQYWEAFDDLLDGIVAAEDDLWSAAWDVQLAQADLTAATETRLRERGMLGWAAAAPDREAVYEQLRAVIDASLELHRFLIENESDITYDPSTGGGEGDPVLEVIPTTPELGDEMWTGVGQITVALDALGYVRQVETEPLLDAVKARLVTVGVR